jgi:hypothetical protein
MTYPHIPPEIQEDVIRALSRGASREDLILSICERTRLLWPEAEAYVNDVEIEYGVEIDTRSAPILTALGGLIILGGLALLAVTMTAIFFGLQNIFSGFQEDDLVYVAGYWLEGGRIMQLSLFLLPMSLGMIIGGTMGIYRRIVPK